MVRALGAERVVFGPPEIAVRFRDRQYRQIRGPNSDQLDLILGKKPRAPAPHRAQTVRSENHRHDVNLTARSPDAYRRLVPKKWIGLSVTRE